MRIGIDMGGMSVKFGLVDRENQIVEKLVIPTRLEIPAEEMIDNMVKAVFELLSSRGLSPADCCGIGIGSPGTIDDENGVIIYSNNFDWENVNIVKQMADQISLPIYIANDADAAALGEVCAGAAKGTKSAVLLTLGTGVGGGVILNGRIFHGPLSGGLELGHMVIKAGGEPCTCGREGCLESYASATALLRMAKRAAQENPSSLMNEMCNDRLENMNGIIPFEAADKGDRAAGEVIEEYMDYLAEGIANVINIFRPELVILGGGIAAQKERLTAPLQARVDVLCFGKEHGQTARIVTSALGNDAGIIGAAGLVGK
ncbi:MAG: ROK family protein [Lachnospiraceae bacterium]|nr:ROK family protein [Lachnospiraceae bacterium]